MGGIWPRGSRPAPLAAPADTAGVLHPKGRGPSPAHSCHPPGQPGVAAPILQPRWVAPPVSRALGTGLCCPFAQLCSRAFVHHRHRSPWWAHDSSGPRPPCCLAGQGRVHFQAGLYPRTCCSFGCDCRIPELLITSSSLPLPFNPRDISKN